MRIAIASAIGAAALLLAAGTQLTRAHEGHDHGPQTTLPKADAAPRGEAASAAFELVAVVQGSELVIHLDRFATNEPVADAGIEVETPAGPATATAANGSYRLPAPWAGKPGHVDLIFTVTAGDAVDVLPVSIDIPDKSATAESASSAAIYRQPSTWLAGGIGMLVGMGLMTFGRRRRVAAALIAAAVALSSSDAFAQNGADAGTDRASRGLDGAVFVPKPIQRIFGLRTVVADNTTHRRSIELPGRIIPDPNASGYVQTSIGGRLSPPPGGFPRLGVAVRQGDVLAHVTPPMQAIDVSDMRQRQGELDQQIAIVTRRLTRYEVLAPSGAVPRAQLDETRMELDGLKERRASLDHIRKEPEALIAPVDGVIAEGTPIAGQIAQTNAIVFQIVDPAKLWVEALSFDVIGKPDSATAVTANGKTVPLTFRGSGLADRNQSIPVHFAIDGENSGHRAGQFVTVFVTSGEQRQGIVLPRTSLVRGLNGQDLIYVHTGAERFEPRPVRIEPLDGASVMVSAGIEPGQRIVVQGADLLDHVR